MSKTIDHKGKMALQLFDWSIVYKPETYDDKPYTSSINYYDHYKNDEFLKRRKSFKEYDEAKEWIDRILAVE